jgi:hypothetical protein
MDLLALEEYARVTAIQIRVYDMAVKKEIFTVGVSPLPRRYYDFALSPDGSRLAVLNDRKVTVWAVRFGPPIAPKPRLGRLPEGVRSCR